MELNRKSAEDIRFQNYVTETAFSLSLTKAQVAELGLIGNEGARINGGHTVTALFRRGLVVPDREDWTVITKWRLSSAGQAVFDLLLVAGLVKRAPKSVSEAA